MMKRVLVSILLCVTVGANAQSQFEKVPSSTSDIDFVNTIKDDKEKSILLYSNFYGGAGVGIGDFNKDGLQDIVFAGNLVRDEIYLNQGNLKFKKITDEAGFVDNGGWSSGVIIFDANNDGWEDIYITRELYDDSPELRRNKLYINQGTKEKVDGAVPLVTFKERSAVYGLDNSERTRHAGVIDFDKDGWLDVFLLNQPPNPGNYSPYMGTNLRKAEWAPRLLRNNQGKFEDVTAAAGILIPCYPNSVVATDFDKDGWTDLYLANDYEAPDMLFRNNGDGTFSEIIKDKLNQISYYSMGVDAADINNDGFLDIMTLDMVAEDNFRLKSNMSGMNPEAFWKIVDQGGHHQYMFNAVHLNNEGQHFSNVAQKTGMSNTDWSWSNVIADFDNNGWKDVFITNGLLRDIRNTDGDKDFAKYVEKFIKKYLKENPNAGDVSLMDILPLEEALDILPSVPLQNYCYSNSGDLNFEKVSDEWGFTDKLFSNACAYADFDNDGDLDLVVSNINAEASLYENKNLQHNNFLQIQLKSTQDKPLDNCMVEISMTDGSSQVIELKGVRGMYSTSQKIAHFGLGKKESVAKLTVRTPYGVGWDTTNIEANQILKIDIDRFSKQGRTRQFAAEKLLQPVPLSFLHSENAFDDYDKQILLPHKYSSEGPAIAVADLNGDGYDDIFRGGAAGYHSVLGIYNKGRQQYDWSAIDQDSLFEDVGAVFFDLEGDGDLDLYVVSGGNEFPPQSRFYQDRLYINTYGVFKSAPKKTAKFRSSGGKVKAADFDGDGDMDLLVCGRHTPWSYPEPATTRLLENQSGKLKDVTSKRAKELGMVGMITDAQWTDYDGDSDLDFILVGEWQTPLVFENNNGTFEKKTLLSQKEGWYYSIESIDVDNDGDMDYLLGNLGENYKYKASVQEPFEVFYKDFDGNGSKDIVLSYYNFGEKYPLRGKSCSSQQIPSISEEFQTYNIFASTNLEGVYGEEELAEALSYAAYDFSSGIAVNNGDGTFDFRKLPVELQLSNINDFEVFDFNSDGYMDIVVANNKFDAEIETARNDAGIGYMALNDKKGNFEVLPIWKSGLCIEKEVKEIEVLQMKDQLLLLMAVNNGTSAFYRIIKQKDSE